MDSLHRALRLARAAERPNAPPVDELIEMPPVSRRRFLQVAAASGLAAVLPGPLEARTSPRVAIVGAGLAGLSAAWRLHQAGVAAHVYEGSGRVGGRVMSTNKVAD